MHCIGIAMQNKGTRKGGYYERGTVFVDAFVRPGALDDGTQQSKRDREEEANC